MNNLRLRDFEILTELPHHSSLRSIARHLKLEPQNLTKLLRRIERECGQKLLSRSSKGVSPTPEALRLAELSRRILALSLEMAEGTSPVKDKKLFEYTFVSRVFMTACLSAHLAPLSEIGGSKVRFRFIDASPKKKEEWARKGLVDIALSVGELDLGKSWLARKVGELEWVFCGRKGHPLGRVTTKRAMQKFQLVTHSHVDGDRLVDVSTFSSDRWRVDEPGHSVETAFSGLQVSSNSDQISFLPRMLIENFPTARPLEIISVKEHPSFKQSVFLSAHMDRVSSKHFEAMCQIVSAHVR